MECVGRKEYTNLLIIFRALVLCLHPSHLMDELELNIGKILRLRIFLYLKIADDPCNNGYDNHGDNNNNNNNSSNGR